MTMALIDPDLLMLLRDVILERPTTTAFYRHFKPRIRQLVGWAAERRDLVTSDDYETVYRTIYSFSYDEPEDAARG
jgi:hypothetical protein